jgi:hypothetical protein
MTNKFIVVGYYTDKYKGEALEFLRTCIECNVPVYCEHVPDKGGWDKNTRHKPTFIRECLDRFDCNIVYVDVDARFQSYPFLFEILDCDIAYFKGKVWQRGIPEVLSGTIFVKNCSLCKTTFDNFIRHCSEPSCELEQTFLERSVVDGAKVEILPIEYCAVSDSPRIQDRKVVILHTQASRRLYG